ncbi:PhzF family phenazine biosynthesis isomerase [Microbacterium sp. M3]|uniref:PhzF family phenazine biosynthesis isomerase n=1 Tax=Microbacterium arthrosphaerae TaxID=792652 RepID=A0ABU4GXF2_9MICO|nr:MULTISPECIES: PhzF family phenazine biosynthesis isomerase [Microbacterium]MDW4571763.1 PhzF family phenazine biosynthesis isomerase [Microbacterium arthrosphaerae]MDW7605618.1 PhzF family phenazine biosynthesis isomerase [Microbacterium sp. M3]
MTSIDIQRWTAFSSDPAGGNPAGVVLDADGLTDAAMLGIAADLGYAETAFVVAGEGGRHRIRYFSPLAEVPFCGHATVAAAAAIGEVEGDGPLSFETPVGVVDIVTESGTGGRRVSFTSVEPGTAPLPADALRDVLSSVGLSDGDLHPAYPPAQAFGGNWHPLVVVADRERFDDFRIDPVRARAVLDARGWPATMIVLWPERADRWHARNVFPVGPIIEDPATGAAAAATGGYLRATQVVQTPARLVILQGSHVGRPSELTVDVPDTGGIVVTGSAARID